MQHFKKILISNYRKKLVSGIFKINVFYLVIFSFAGRYFRYQIVTALTYVIGPKMIEIYNKIDKTKKVISNVLIILFIAMILILAYIIL